MALCKDCLHREVCEHLVTWTTINLDDIPPEIPCSHFKDTADVVPKREVEFLQASKNLHEAEFNEIKAELELRNAEIETLKARLEVYKSEFAREIFEEIEKYNCKPLPECKPVYIIMASEFAELKKKYTEDKNG